MRNLNKTTRNICGRLLSLALALVMGCLMIAETLPVTAIAADSPTGAPVTEPDNGQPGNAGGNVVVIPQPANPGGNIVIDAQPLPQNKVLINVTPDDELEPDHNYRIIGPNYEMIVYVTPEGVVQVLNMEYTGGDDKDEDKEDDDQDGDDQDGDDQDGDGQDGDDQDGDDQDGDKGIETDDLVSQIVRDNKGIAEDIFNVVMPSNKVKTDSLDTLGMSNAKRAKIGTSVITQKAVTKTVVAVKLGPKVKKIESKAFSKGMKVKQITIDSSKRPFVSKDAFKNLKKSDVKKIKVKVTKKMSKKEFKKLKKQLIKAGLKSSNILRVNDY